MGRSFVDHSGKKFGRLTVVRRAGKDPFGSIVWLCRCSCGNTRKVHAYNLVHIRRPVRSCGCYRKEFLTKCSRSRPCVIAARKRRLRGS